MNDKEKELWRVIDNVIKCCAITNPDGTLSITREEVLGKSRAENLVMARCMVVEQMTHAGFSTTTIAQVLKQLNPQYAKDKARDERIADIETEVAGMKDNIAKILAAVTKT